VAPGDEYNTVLLERSREVLNNLGYFSSVEFFPNDAEIEGFKDVNIALTEKSTGTINFGVGFSSIDSLVGFLDITQSNFDLWNYPRFSGGGQKFRASVKLGTERRDVVVSLTEPWFMGRKLALGGEVFYRDIYYLSDLYDQSQVGAAVSLRKPVGEHNSVSTEYRIQQIEIDNIDPAATAVIRSEAGTYLQSRPSTRSSASREACVSWTRRRADRRRRFSTACSSAARTISGVSIIARSVRRTSGASRSAGRRPPFLPRNTPFRSSRTRCGGLSSTTSVS
jgi:outer membrane protein assembly factor BamA